MSKPDPLMDARQTSYFQTFKFRWSLLLLAALVVFVLLANAHQVKPPAQATAPTPTTAEAEKYEVKAVPPPEHSVALINAPSDTINRHIPEEDALLETILVSHGDTLSGILDRFNVHSALGDLLGMKKQVAPLLNLKPGNPIHLKIKSGELSSLVYELSHTEHLEVIREDGRYAVTTRTLPVEKREAYAFGTVRNSFYRAALKAGLSDKTIIEIANILGWDIDFVLDVRSGDRFSVIYEAEYLDGDKLRDCKVQAVEFLNNGKVHRAILYTGTGGKSDYFTPDGRSTRKPFLRNPIEYARVSSHFNPRRLHPVFKVVRPHRGVDYAAPTGTPVRASGDGRITFRGRKPGYGNVVIIQHSQAYSTLYAHLSKFAGGLRRNPQVKQKQVIGYVGSTGYATGPHLHYEFRVNDVHKNPLTVKLPSSKPLPKSKMANFKKAISQALAKLDTLNKAYASTGPPR